MQDKAKKNSLAFFDEIRRLKSDFYFFRQMRLGFEKVKTEHHILSEFHEFLRLVEQHPEISRIIPGRIHRQQKASSDLRFSISYPTVTGFKAKMSKGSTSQELFVITREGSGNVVSERILEQRKRN